MDIKSKIGRLKKQLDGIIKALNLDKGKKRIAELEVQSSRPDFWQDRQQAQEAMQELAELKDEQQTIKKLQDRLSELEELEKLVSEKNDITELEQEVGRFISDLTKLNRQTYFTGPYDKGDAILSVHAGQGGTEACDWAQMLQRMYQRYMELKHWQAKLIDEHPGEEAGIKSVTIMAKGRYAYGYLKNERGTHRLVRLSPFNADNLRQTSFALVQVLPLLPDNKMEINPDDLKVNFSRSSGHGGQNVNKVSTAVRLEHISTGIVVTSQSERSQEQNRKIALSLLRAKLWEKQAEAAEKEMKAIKGGKTMASWGTQIRSYVLHPYKLVKDLRTGYEEHDPDSVLNGHIEAFIIRALQIQAGSL